MKALRSCFSWSIVASTVVKPWPLLLEVLARRFQGIDRLGDRFAVIVDRLAQHRQRAMNQPDARGRMTIGKDLSRNPCCSRRRADGRQPAAVLLRFERRASPATLAALGHDQLHVANVGPGRRRAERAGELVCFSV